MDRPCLQRASGEEADLTSTSTAAAAKLCGVMDRDIFWSRRSETETEAREGGREVFCLKCQPGNAISEEGGKTNELVLPLRPTV